ncbi:MAG: hypothetical protein LHW57_05925 [Candidatus Cloacimonetes bacterium]|nr:hypothetical protein [Candidatus Cloacimonadota bacterium]
MLNFAIYVSDHGFGHATRMAALAEEFIRFGIFVHIRSARPEFIWRNLDPNYSEIHPHACDVGVKHGKNLAPDLEATRSALLALMGRRLDIVEREVEFLRREKIDLIVADIPWLAVEAGTYARVPVFAISNFDWLYIYAKLFKGDADLRPLLNTIFGLYQRVDRAFRLPMSSPASMGCFRQIEKTGLLAARKATNPDLIRDLGIDTAKPLLVCSFGGAGEMELDLKKLCAAFEGTVASAIEVEGISNHVRVPRNADFSALIGAADILLTKPGYSSFAEAIQGGKHLIYSPRENYPEEDILILGIASYSAKTELPSLLLAPAEWKKVFCKIKESVRPVRKVPNANSRIAALLIQRYMELRHGGKNLLSVFDAGSNNLNYALCEAGTPVPIHTAQIMTGLGRQYRVLPGGRVRVAAKQLSAFKRAVSAFMLYNKHIASRKQVIATGIHRRSDLSADLTQWFKARWNAEFKVLSEEAETELVALAARDLIPAGQRALIVDIGGFSTELVLPGSQNKAGGVSLSLGLLTLHRAQQDGFSAETLIRQQLNTVADLKPDAVICVGLSAVFLAKIIKKIAKYQPAKIHGVRIGREELEQFLRLASRGGTDELITYSVEKKPLGFLSLSARFYTLLLDKFGASEFIVCYYGISSGYNLWPQRRKKHG